jgi:hypothetical protein
MAIQIKQLKAIQLASTEGDVLTPSTTSKSTLVKSIRLVNVTSNPVTINLFVRKTSTGTSYRIVPKDLVLAAGAAFIDDSEITLEGGGGTQGVSEDRIRGSASTSSAVDCVISGLERDV